MILRLHHTFQSIGNMDETNALHGSSRNTISSDLRDDKRVRTDISSWQQPYIINLMYDNNHSGH